MRQIDLKLKSDWIGLKVEALQEIRCGEGTAPLGTIFLVTRNFGGLHLTRDHCSGCGCRFYVRGVDESHVRVRWDLTDVAAYNLERTSRDSKLRTITQEEPIIEIKPSILNEIDDHILRIVQHRGIVRPSTEAIAFYSGKLYEYPDEMCAAMLKAMDGTHKHPDEDLAFLIRLRNRIDKERRFLSVVVKWGTIPLSMMLG